MVLSAPVAGRPQSGAQARRHQTILAMAGTAGIEIASIVILYPTPEAACSEMHEAYGFPVSAPPTNLLVTSPVRRLLTLIADPRREPSLCWKRRALHRWIEPRLRGADVVFVEAGYDEIASSLSIPAIADLDDLEVQRVDQRISAIKETLHRRGRGSPRSWSERLVVRLRLVAEMERRRRWRTVQNRTLATAAAVLVCSDADRTFLEVEPVTGPRADIVVVPNGYESTREPVGFDEARRPGAVAFVGHFGYRPNIDAIEWFVDQVWPRLVGDRPGIGALVVGMRSDEIGLERHAGVVTTGRVDDPVDSLAEADVVVVPLQSGVGTRLKIIEAWAAGLPVVSTSIGAYGLGTTDGVDLLIADTPEDFGAAVERLLDDVSLRRLLRQNGFRRASDMTWDRSRAEMVRVVVSVARPDA